MLALRVCRFPFSELGVLRFPFHVFRCSVARLRDGSR